MRASARGNTVSRPKRRLRSQTGGPIVEAAAAMALLVPLLLLLILAIVEISEYFVLKQQVAYVARQAAHEIAYGYGALNYTTMNSGGKTSGAANTGDPNYASIINNIAVPGIINQNSTTQIKTYFYIPNSPSLAQSYVQVNATYKTGPNLPNFPWNPLNTSFAHFDLAGINVNSLCSWPIPH